jgi:hypothetical protein
LRLTAPWARSWELAMASRPAATCSRMDW